MSLHSNPFPLSIPLIFVFFPFSIFSVHSDPNTVDEQEQPINTCDVDKAVFDGIETFIWNGRSYPRSEMSPDRYQREYDTEFPWFSGLFGCTFVSNDEVEKIPVTVIEKHGAMEDHDYCLGDDSFIVYGSTAFLCVDDWMDLCSRSKVRVSMECLLSRHTSDCWVIDEWLCSWCDCSEDFYLPFWAKETLDTEKYGTFQFDEIRHFVNTRFVNPYNVHGEMLEIEELEYQEMERVSAKKAMEVVPRSSSGGSNKKRKIKLYVCLFC